MAPIAVLSLTAKIAVGRGSSCIRLSAASVPALSIRFFADALRSEPAPGLTWSAVQESALAGGERVEADFLLWYRRGVMFSRRSILNSS